MVLGRLFGGQIFLQQRVRVHIILLLQPRGFLMNSWSYSALYTTQQPEISAILFL